jgi:hypothetical protein
MVVDYWVTVQAGCYTSRLARWCHILVCNHARSGGDAAWITGQVINTEGGFRRWD